MQLQPYTRHVAAYYWNLSRRMFHYSHVGMYYFDRSQRLFTVEERKARDRTIKARSNRAWKLKNSEYVKAEKIKWMREWRLNNPEQHKKRRRTETLKKYNLSIAEYDALVAAQQDCCAICGTSRNGTKRLAVDHCHKTGTVRRLLCQDCNLGLGRFKDNINLLEAAIRYLQGFNS